VVTLLDRVSYEQFDTASDVPARDNRGDVSLERHMIEKLRESRGTAFGFKVIGKLTNDDVTDLSQEIENVIVANKKPIGLLADLSDMHGATWAARWDEMRFLQRHTDHIARMAVICNDEWQEISEMILIAASFMQAETVYCHLSEIHHAWHWVRMNAMEESMPIRVMYPGRGLFQDYTPEYVGI
jgi:hypothetical protein